MKNVLLLLTPSNPQRLEGIALFAKSRSWHLTIADHLTHSLDGWNGHGALVTLRDDAGMLSYVRRLRRHGVHIVDLSLSRPDINLPRVAGDNAAIGRMAAEHFKSKRYKNAAWFSTGWGHQHELRYAAFSEAMEDRCEKWAWALASRKSGADNWNALSRWLKAKLCKAPHPLAVFCFDDADASRVESVAIDAGLSVPGDVAVLGVGDDRVICENQAVPISSVKHDIHRIGYTGAALLDRLMNGDEPPPSGPFLVKPGGVAERSSTDTLAISSDIVRKVRDIFIADMANPPSTAQLAERLGISRSTLDRAFAEDIELSPSKMLMRMRIDEAKHLMTSTDLTLAEIAARLGWCNAAYFTNIFRDSEGVAPRKWRKRYLPKESHPF
jgi:LacI family transcriptional regulator